jgi:uncharacterized alkaline shock family protein YloU
MDQNKKHEYAKVDKKEFEIPTTTFVRDIEDRVFQGIVLHCLSKVEGISLVEGNFIDNILGRNSLEGIKGIHTAQDSKHQCVTIRVEVNVSYGVSIPHKAEEIQSKIAEEVTSLTGLHVATVHVVFKHVLPAIQNKKISEALVNSETVLIESDEEYK